MRRQKYISNYDSKSGVSKDQRNKIRRPKRIDANVRKKIQIRIGMSRHDRAEERDYTRNLYSPPRLRAPILITLPPPPPVIIIFQFQPATSPHLRRRGFYFQPASAKAAAGRRERNTRSCNTFTLFGFETDASPGC